MLPIKYPTSLSSKGKILPSKSWILAKTTDGRLITNLTDNKTGINKEFSVTQFQRGDAVQFKLNVELLLARQIDKGDTIGYVISNEIEKDIERLKGELETARASLIVQQSSEKESIIEAEKSKLEFARKELEEQTKIYNRKKKLFEKDLIAEQEFEADEARYELAKINIDIAEQRLRSVQSGAKQEEIKFVESQIIAIEKEIGVLQKRFESNNITSPINGIVNRTFSSDTLVLINDTSECIILTPVPLNDTKEISIDQPVEILSENADKSIQASVFSIDNSVYTINNIQYKFITAVSNGNIIEFQPGLNVECKFDTGMKTLLTILIDNTTYIFN